MSLQERMQKVIRQDVQSMHAYAIQPSAGFTKLDAMENPFTLPPELQRELGDRLGRVAINRYPAQSSADVVARLSAFVGLPAGCKLTLGNGSDELLQLLKRNALETPETMTTQAIRSDGSQLSLHWIAAGNKIHAIESGVVDRQDDRLELASDLRDQLILNWSRPRRYVDIDATNVRLKLSSLIIVCSPHFAGRRIPIRHAIILSRRLYLVVRYPSFPASACVILIHKDCAGS